MVYSEVIKDEMSQICDGAKNITLPWEQFEDPSSVGLKSCNDKKGIQFLFALDETPSSKALKVLDTDLVNFEKKVKHVRDGNFIDSDDIVTVRNKAYVVENAIHAFPQVFCFVLYFWTFLSNEHETDALSQMCCHNFQRTAPVMEFANFSFPSV